jgi:hypothetical protein
MPKTCLIYRLELATARNVTGTVVGQWPLPEICLVYRWTLVDAEDVSDILFDTGHC